MNMLNQDLQLLCNNIAILLEDKAATWFWRFHSQVGGNVTWPILYHFMLDEFKERRTDYDLRELIRNRKQKANERFETFLEQVSLLVDRLGYRLEERELVEILKRNVHPELREKLVFMPIFSVSQLREYALRHEILQEELSRSTRATASRTVAEVDLTSEEVEPFHVDAISRDISSWKCWNCSEMGHGFRQCSQPKRVFCLRCGKPEVFTPQCPNCAAKSKNPTATSVSKPPTSL